MEKKEPKITPEWYEKNCEPVLQRLRELILRRGDGAFRDFTRQLGLANPNLLPSQKRVNPDAFKAHLVQFGLILPLQDIVVLNRSFHDPAGYILLEPFATALFATLSEKRERQVRAVWNKLDPRGTGEVQLSVLMESYVPNHHPLVRQSAISVADAMVRLTDVFDKQTQPKGTVSRGDFVCYCQAVSHHTGPLDDAAFTAAVVESWGLPATAGTLEARGGDGDAMGCAHGTTTRHGCALIPDTIPREAFPMPKKVVGYRGHLPGAQERFGETFNLTQATVNEIAKKQFDTVYRDTDETVWMVKKPNRANAHNFSLA